MLKGKVALITGASSGIGAAVAKRFAFEGAHVILVARNLAGLEESDNKIKELGGEATLISLDLMDYKKIPALSSLIHARFKKLDILVGSAAIFDGLTLISDCDDVKCQEIFAVNFMANFHLIKHFDYLLKASPNGRVIFVTSGLIKKENPSFWGPYAISKSALEALALTYAAETAHTKLKINLVDPGEINSPIYLKAFPGKSTGGLTTPDDITEIFIKLASDNCKFTGRIHYAQF